MLCEEAASLAGCSWAPGTTGPARCMRLAELCAVMHGPSFSSRPMAGRGRDSLAFHVVKQQDQAFSEPREENFSYTVCFFLIWPFLSSRQFGGGSYFSYIIRTILGLLATNTKAEQNCLEGRGAGMQQTAPEPGLSFPCCRSHTSPELW